MTKILIADDNPVSRELIREVLELSHYEIIEASNGQEALERTEQSAPDLVLLDIEMPLLNGFGVLRQLRGNPRFASLPVLALTAYAMQGDREKALAAGFDEYITKPISAVILRAQIEKLLRP
jgi:two-component system cell cycle response regulator DivK